MGRRVVANSGPTLVLIFTSLLSARRSGMAPVASGAQRAPSPADGTERQSVISRRHGYVTGPTAVEDNGDRENSEER